MRPTFLTLPLLFWMQSASAQLIQPDSLKIYTSYQEALKDPEHVYKLDLSNLELNFDTLDFKKFKNLTYLSFHHDHLNNIPKSVFHLRNIKVLDLSNNHIQTIPKKIRSLKHLQELDLSGNQLLDIPKNMRTLSGLPELRKLYLTPNNSKENEFEMNLNADRLLYYGSKPNGYILKGTLLNANASPFRKVTIPQMLSNVYLPTAQTNHRNTSTLSLNIHSSANDNNAWPHLATATSHYFFSDVAFQLRSSSKLNLFSTIQSYHLLFPIQLKHIPLEPHTAPGAGFRFAF